MNVRAFIGPPWLEVDAAGVWTVVVEALHWCGHPRFGSSIHRTPFVSVEAALAYLDRLGFTVPALAAA